MESWVEVESKGERLLISSSGLVKVPARSTSYMRNGAIVTAKFREGLLSPYKTRTGYYEVRACIGTRKTKHLLHRLVGMAFVPGYQPGLTINHINGNKLDNRHSNLEWVSVQRNSQHAWEIGLVNLRGEANPGSKLTSKRVVYIRRLLSQGISAHTIAIVAGVSQSLISKIRDGRAWDHVHDDALFPAPEEKSVSDEQA